MHFEINPSRNKPIGYIRNSYREDGKVKHQTISKIHGLSLDQLQNMKAAFDGKTIAREDVILTDGREYGASALLFHLAKRIGLDKIIYSRNEPWVRDILAMVIGRIVYQGSKLALSKVSEYSCLWEICGVTDQKIDVDKHCYDAMDELLARRQFIQKKLATKHLSEGSAILYDMTSSYFEGEYDSSELVTYGYNRDKKRGKKQITIALICTKEGCPVAVEVFAGNTTDCTTVESKIMEIKSKYNISNFIFVGDRGMLTQKNIELCSDIPNITALTHSAIKKLCEGEHVQLSLFDEDTGTEITLPEEPLVRYILRKNPARGAKEQKTRQSLVKKTEEELFKIAIPKRKADDKTLAARAAKVFYKYKTEKYFSWAIQGGRIIYSRKTDVIAEAEKYDGLYVIRSNVPSALMNTLEVVNAYKSLINVETAFRNIKTVQLEIRPMYHKTDDRIKAHVFICMLSYYLLWHMNMALAPLYNEQSVSYTHDQVIEIMKSRQKCKMSVADTAICTYMIAQPTTTQKIIHNLVLGSSDVA
jgi:transposase